jgi:hypothetical protein
MADFIAVIRRAVDGLTDNTPDMRVKVYERARGAVQRQLENMKPRPPEAMLQRQLEKLEAAIREVEAEHADALPADDAVAATAAAAPIAAAEPDVVAAPEPVVEQANEVSEAEPAQEHQAYEEPAYHEPANHEPVHEQPDDIVEAPVAVAPVEHYEPSVSEEPAQHHVPEPEVHHEPEAHAVVAHDAPVFDDEPHVPAVSEAEPAASWQMPVYEQASEPVADDTHGHDFAAAPDVEPYVEPAAEIEHRVQPAASDFDPRHRLVEPVHAFEQPHEFVEQVQDAPLHADAAGHFDHVWNEPAEAVPEPSTKTVPPTDWALEELRQFSEASHTAPVNDAARAFDDVISGLEYPPEPARVAESARVAEPVKMPAASESFSWEAAAFDDLPPIDSDNKAPVAARYDDGDLFSEIHGSSAQQADVGSNDDWQEATQLRGYDNRGVVAEDDDGLSLGNTDDDIASKFQGKNFRMEPKRRRFGIGSIVGILIALGVVGGGGYAAYTHQGALTDMVKGLVSAAPSQTAQTTPPAAGTTASAAPADAQKEVASLDGSAAGNKFTQRLMADGTEVDSGPAAPPNAQVAEGKSVAEQNVASSEPVAPAAATAPATTTPPSTDPTAATAAPEAPATTPAAAQTAPVGSSEKLFLYEERIGQSSPTAIQGSIVWSLQHEADANGKQEASVQGMLTVPERNLTAQLTFKRNSDPSLPASHIVEMVFSLPQNFEGGAIDSVQRISMKRTEQDRGDPLIAVPAKITDDFHMIALNDYPDARKANLDLLATRDWIDIPITYRNGRRALLTMQKGTTGTEAFTAAIREWNAAGDVSTSQ